MRIDISLLPVLAAAFMLAFARIGAMVMLLPGLGETNIPVRIKLAIALLLTLIILPLHRADYHIDMGSIASILTLMMYEIFIGILLGGLIGMIAGYSRGLLAAVLMRVLDILIAFPSLVLALAIAEGLGPGELHVIWALSFYSVPAFARLARAATLRLRDQNFMLAASLSGTPRWRIVLSHLAPNLLPQLMTFALLGAGVAIIQEGALSFLSLGVPPPGASWGNMIAEGMQTMSVRPSLVLLPCLALLITVAALNLLGDALRARWSAR